MKLNKTRKPYCPPSCRDRRDEAKAKVLECAQGALLAWDDQKSAMSKEEYRLRVRYAHLELRRVAEALGFDTDCWRVPELKDIPY